MTDTAAHNICGVVIHVRPEQVEPISGTLARLPGTEVHARTPDGRIIVTVEDTDGQSAADGILALHRLSGVIDAALVYHAFE